MYIYNQPTNGFPFLTVHELNNTTYTVMHQIILFDDV